VYLNPFFSSISLIKQRYATGAAISAVYNKNNVGNFGNYKSFHSFAPQMIGDNTIQERIAHTAKEMMLNLGIRSVSMDDIANKLGMSKKTIYQYFADKDSLVSSVFDHLIGMNCDLCTRDNKASENAIHEALLNIETVSAMYQSINKNVLNDLWKYHPQVFSNLQKHKDDYVFDLVKSNILRGQKELLYRENLEVDILARYRIEALFIFFSESFRNHINASFEVIEREVITHFIYGLVTPLGYEMIEKYKKTFNTHSSNNEA
jgi:AcrR family transcriptional regulator